MGSRGRGLTIVVAILLVGTFFGDANAHTVRARTKVLIDQIDPEIGAVQGTVRSPKARCVDGRTVTLFIDGVEAGTTDADIDGQWTIDTALSSGDRLVAKVAKFFFKKGKAHKHGCAADASETWKVPHKLDVSVEGGGHVVSDPAGIDCTSAGGDGCSAFFDDNASITAIPEDDFVQWGGDCSGTNNNCQLDLEDSDRSVTATFDSDPEPTTKNLFVDVTGPGTVTGPQINCTSEGGDCEATYEEGTPVTLTATPAGLIGEFDGWGGDCAGTASTCQLTMTTDRAAAAVFGCLLPDPLCGIALTVIEELS